MENKCSPKIAFLFKEGRKLRSEAKTESYPTEFFYGYTQLKAANVDVSLFEEGDILGSKASNLVLRALNRVSHGVFGINAWAFISLLKPTTRTLFNNFDFIVTTSNIFAVVFGAAKFLGLIKPHVIAIIMGVITPDMPFYRRWFMLLFMKRVRLAALSREEISFLKSMDNGSLDLNYLPFGVDADFWKPSEDVPSDNAYVLSIGSDPYRDYQTLIKSWHPSFPKLRIITKIPVSCTAPNIEVIEGSWGAQTISDSDIRRQMQNAQFVIIPLRQTIQPSGQSACLQAMACGKAVILSNTDGLWDRGLMQDGRNCLLIDPGDSTAINTVVTQLLDDPNKVSAIGEAARLTVVDHLNVNAMAEEISHQLCVH